MDEHVARANIDAGFAGSRDVATDRPRDATRHAGATAISSLPFARSSARGRDRIDSTLVFELAPKACEAIADLSLRTGVARAIVALAAFETALQRYAGLEQIGLAFGSGTAGSSTFRSIDVADDPSFLELVRRLASTSSASTASAADPCPIGFDYVERGAVEPMPHDLRVVLVEAPGSIGGEVRWDASRLDAYHVERIPTHLETILVAAREAPETAMSRLRILTDDERETIVERWNDTRAPMSDALVFDAFETRARETPEAVAVIANGATVTYGELEARANRLAHLLREHGVARGTMVGVFLERTERMIVSVLAVLKAGGAYVPLDPAYPADRLAYMLSLTEAKVVLTQASLRGRLPDGSFESLVLDSLDDVLATRGATPPSRASEPDDLAYVIFTSGSTGRPKGVMVRHRPVVNVLSWVNATFGVGRDDRLLFVTSLSFDLSVYDIFGVLGAGGSIRMASEHELRDPAELLAILSNEPITIWDSAPAALQQLVPFIKEPAAGAPLSLVMLSGDWIPVPLPDTIRRTFPAARVMSLGGATEATIWSNWYPIGAVDPSWPSIPYGKPIRNARYHVLDRHLEPLPVGVPGDLHIGGEVLADGYFARSDLTEERFISDPFVRGGRLYKTGDLARYLPSGDLEFLGRIDHQVKVRGFRVEAGEIESVLAQQPGVEEAVVKPFKDAGGQNYLVAFVVPREGAALDESVLRAALAARLPEYMVPAQIVIRSALPRTPNGKLDRAALDAPKRVVASSPAEALEDPIEARIAAIWARELGFDRVGRHDDFFALGGHSLRAAQIMVAVNEAFDLDLRLPILFENPNVAALATAVREAKTEARSEARIVRRDAVTRGPASLVQQRFWFLDRTIAKPSVYNVSDAIRIEGALDVDSLRAAWNAVIERHDVLRTTFENVDGWPLQILHDTGRIEIPLVDVSDAPDPEARWASMFAEDARAGFDLENGPLHRAHLVRLGADRHVLFWTFHHVVIDESSRAVLLSDLLAAYQSRVRGEATSLPRLAVRYLDYGFAQRARVTNDAIAYWKATLKDAPPPIVPPHPKPRRETRDFEGETIAAVLSEETTARMAALARSASVTPYVAWLAAFETLLFRYTGQSDVCVGSPISVRPSAARDIVGCFVNTVAIRTDLSADPTFRELLGRTRHALLGAIRHGDVPFEKLVEELKPERTPGGHPLFQTLFVYQGEPLSGSVGALRFSHERMERVGAKFDVTLTVEEKNGRTSLFFEYASALYDRETAERMLSHLRTLVDSILEAPDSRLAALRILRNDEEARVISALNETSGEFPRESSVQSLVEARVDAKPEAIAFSFRDDSLTFAELDARANQLAHHLRSIGVSRETLVGLCVDRSLDMPVAMLGILKAGAAYVPLDPDFPPDRLAFYIADSRMPVVVANGHLLENLPIGDARAVRIDDDAEAIGREPRTRPAAIGSSSDLAYVLYTSGSTGRPNGVAVEHRSLTNLLTSFAREPGLGPRDTILSITTLSFDIHTVETWLPMVTGARAVIVPRETALDGHRLLDLIAAGGTTVMQSTPATFRLLLAAGWEGAEGLVVFVGGEALSYELAQELLARTREVWNVYGPTETTVWSVIHRVRAEDDRVRIGHPILNTRAYVLDPTSRTPMPIGCVGELFIAGEGLARGYLGRDDLTASRFVPDPFVGDGNARMYKTGDLARWLDDGTLECLGRLDHQVKIRGFRIELNEIERVLEAHDGLAQAVVVARTDDEFAAMLHAYYRPVAGHDPTPSDLRRFARGRLPDYMVPATFTRLESFPQTPNGKVDRKALPAPTIESTATSQSAEHVAPANDAELALVELWEEVLGVRPIGVTDDFHELGGHSLLAAALMSRIESRLGHRIPIEVLFEKPTVRQLADSIIKKLEFGKGAMVPLETRGTHPPLFLVAGVGGHVFAFNKFAHVLGPDFPSYGMKAIGVDGSEPPLDRFEDIARRYVEEILRERPTGPYVLGGYSVGGRIAFEVALQLEALGKSVPRLIVFDMFAPGFPRPLPPGRRLLFHVRRLLEMPLAEKRSYLRARVNRLLLTRENEALDNHELAALGVVPSAILKTVGAALLRANDRYMPTRKLRGQIVLIQSNVVEEWEGAVEHVERQGWSDWSYRPVEEHTISAGHLEFFRDAHQPALAAIVGRVLEDARRETGATPGNDVAVAE